MGDNGIEDLSLRETGMVEGLFYARTKHQLDDYTQWAAWGILHTKAVNALVRTTITSLKISEMTLVFKPEMTVDYVMELGSLTAIRIRKSQNNRGWHMEISEARGESFIISAKSL